jgi:hypothetical protein
MLPLEASPMRPKFLGPNYGVRDRKRDISAGARGSRTSFRKTILGAVVAVAATVIIPVLYGQVVGEKRTEDAAGGTRFFGNSTTPATAKPGVEEAVVALLDPTPRPGDPQPDSPAATTDAPLNMASPRALVGVAEAGARASTTPNAVAPKSPDKPRIAPARKVVRVRHHQPHRADPSADFFTAISKFGRSRELRAALQLLQ